jgi:hypothetical protein
VRITFDPILKDQINDAYNEWSHTLHRSGEGGTGGVSERRDHDGDWHLDPRFVDFLRKHRPGIVFQTPSPS